MNKIPVIIILLIIAFGLRFYNINNTFGFYGDQGRDLIDIFRWFKTGNIPLTGPSASVGDFHLGPLYYYLIAPFLIIFQYHPITGAYFSLFYGIVFILVSFLLIERLIDRYTAFIFCSLVTFSPMAIFLSKGSWNPNLVPLMTILLIFSVIQFIQSNRFLFIFLSGVLIGMGAQFHYTFLSNILSLAVVLLIFKTKAILQYKTWTFFLLGFIIPLLPFFVGQVQNSFLDITNLQIYLERIKNAKSIFLFQTLIDRLYFPFYVFFPTPSLPWFVRFLAVPIWLLVLLSVVLISFSKTRLSFFSKIILTFFLAGSLQSMVARTNFYNHYYLNLGIMTILLVSIYISYLYQYARLKFIWFLPLSLFLVWQIYLIPNYLGTERNPQIVLEAARLIVNDVKSSEYDPSIGVFVMSPVTISQGFEYRYILEKEGLNTFSSSRPDSADYLIIEKTNNESINFKNNDPKRKIFKIGGLSFDTKIGVIKYVEVYKIEKI